LREGATLGRGHPRQIVMRPRWGLLGCCLGFQDRLALLANLGLCYGIPLGFTEMEK
jgi:hypothetical protein